VNISKTKMVSDKYSLLMQDFKEVRKQFVWSFFSLGMRISFKEWWIGTLSLAITFYKHGNLHFTFSCELKYLLYHCHLQFNTVISGRMCLHFCFLLWKSVRLMFIIVSSTSQQQTLFS
jgi:hypothetical protein